MKLIAHRGLIAGPNQFQENHPDSISKCLNMGLDVEVDVRYIDNKWYLGHDAAQYQVNQTFIDQLGLWIHSKNPEACFELNRMYHKGKVWLNYFWHENDERVLTSCGYLWTFPNKVLTKYSVAVMPEWYVPLENLSSCKNWDCYAVCSDYISLIR